MKTKHNEDGQAKETELLEQIGQLQMVLQWPKKISTACTPVNCANWSINPHQAQRQQAV
jgi:hypothetical protein